MANTAASGRVRTSPRMFPPPPPESGPPPRFGGVIGGGLPRRQRQGAFDFAVGDLGGAGPGAFEASLVLGLVEQGREGVAAALLVGVDVADHRPKVPRQRQE